MFPARRQSWRLLPRIFRSRRFRGCERECYVRLAFVLVAVCFLAFGQCNCQALNKELLVMRKFSTCCFT